MTDQVGEPVGIVEIADRLGVERTTVDQWRQRGVIPQPRWTVGGRPAWDWETITAWAQATSRLSASAEDGEQHEHTNPARHQDQQ